MIDRSIFFAETRRRLARRGWTQSQVDGLTILLDERERREVFDLRWLAYALATAFHETAFTFQPVREIGLGKGRAYGRRDPRTGQAYYGRGFVQLTWKRNYLALGQRCGVDLVVEPDRALEPQLAARISSMRRRAIGKARGASSMARIAPIASPPMRDSFMRPCSLRRASTRPRPVSHPASGVGCARCGPRERRVFKQRNNRMKGYRTIAFNTAAALVGVAQGIDWISVVGTAHAGWAVAAISIANIVLRSVTTSPVGEA